MHSSPQSSPRSRAKRRAERALLAFAAGAAIGLVGAGAARAYVRIAVNGEVLAWSSQNLTWNLHLGGSQDIADGSHEVALAKAFDAWQSVAGSTLAIVRGADTANGPESATHVVMFDENGATGYFPPSAGIVALTPISFDLGSGAILDADIIFNARDYGWSTDGTLGTFDVQDVATHEIGHFIGLDHSPTLTGSMWPYVSLNQWLHRSLSLDDRSGAIAVAEQGSQTRLSGTVRRSGNPVSGAAVCAVNADDGRLAAIALSESDGSWVLRGAPIGNYFVYACPLEGAMSAANLTGNGAVSTNFAAAFYGGFNSPTTFALGAAGNVICGNLALPANAALSETTSTSVLLRRGQSQYVTVFGGGFTAGQMDFLVKSPHLALSQVTSGTTWTRALVTVATAATLGSYDVYVRDPSGVFDAATGVLEVIAAAPLVQSLSATSGAASGGYPVDVVGTGFQNGAYVLFGGVEALAVEFVDASTLRATAPSAAPGLVPVAVHNPDGQHDALEDAFLFSAQAEFTQLFPAAGQAAGGTRLLINGGAFAQNMQVLLDGQALAVTWRSERLVEVTTPAHAAAAVELILRNPGEPDTVLPGAFQFVDSPDPAIASFTPTLGPKTGGTRVRLTGANLAGVVEVRFGVDPITALGGTAADAVAVISGARVDATTVSHASAGVFGVVAVTASGQAALAGGFTFEGTGSANPGGSGLDLPGGGCAGSLGGRTGDPAARAGDACVMAVWIGAFLLLRRRRI
jgi:hypothetical protein